MTHTNKTYKFSNFEELYRTVPADRIEDCMYELCQMLVTTRQVEDLIIETSRAAGTTLDPSKPIMTFPAEIEWVDDGNGQLNLTLADPNGVATSFKFKVEDIH